LLKKLSLLYFSSKKGLSIQKDSYSSQAGIFRENVQNFRSFFLKRTIHVLRVPFLAMLALPGTCTYFSLTLMDK
jgi:hypothetical protein